MAKPLFDTDAVHVARLAEACPVVSGAVVSTPLLNTAGLKQILFAIDEGQGLSDHQAPFVATIHVLAGRMRFTCDGEDRTMVAGEWIVLPPGAMHALEAEEPTRFLLTMVPETA